MQCFLFIIKVCSEMTLQFLQGSSGTSPQELQDIENQLSSLLWIETGVACWLAVAT